VEFAQPKTIIGISNIVTWAKTKPESEDGDGTITEDDYRRRKPHPNFKAHVEAEKEITKLSKKANVRSYVIAPGLVYHPGDSIFHYMFKAAWHNEPEILCFGNGSNVLPTIHLDDLLNIIIEVIETAPEKKYLVAVDDGKSTLLEITTAIAQQLGTGSVKKVIKEEAFLLPTVSQADYDMLTVNLKIDPGYIKEMSFEWKNEVCPSWL
jgi:adenylate kinase